MLRKGPPESATICLQDLENNNKHKYARQLALEPPGPTQRGFFQRLFFTPANPQLSKNLAQWEMQCITGSWVLSQCERSFLGWSRPGEDNTGGYNAPCGSQLIPKFAQICNIILLLVTNNQKYNLWLAMTHHCYNDRIMCLLGISCLWSTVEYHGSKMCSLHTWLFMPHPVDKGHLLTSLIVTNYSHIYRWRLARRVWFI